MEPSIVVAASGAQLRWRESGLLAVSTVSVNDILGVLAEEQTLVVHYYPPVEVCAAESRVATSRHRRADSRFGRLCL